MPPEGTGRAARARRAVATCFFLNGAVLASWVPHVPAVKGTHGLGDDELGLLLLCMALGAVGTLPFCGRIVARLGSRAATILSAALLCLVLPCPVLAPSAPLVGLALFALGSANACLDVSMNTQATEVETAIGRPIMSSFHALFSAGGLVGAALASAAMVAGATDGTHVLAASGIGIVTLVGFSRTLLPSEPRPATPRGQRPALSLPVLQLGALAFCGLLAEGAMADWTAVYLRDGLGSDVSVAALGFAAFSAAMAAGRWTGDAMRDRLGAAALLRGSAAVAATGMVFALVITHPIAGIAGFAVVGLGIANVIPILFGAAARVPNVPPWAGIAAVATVGYAGFLAGPPAIGLVAESSSLGVGLALVGIACAVIALQAHAVQ